MYCPFCRHPDRRVVDSRTADDGTAIRRRRSCPECGRRFTTQETAILTVQAQRRHRAVQPGQDRQRRPAGLPGPPRHRGPAGPAGPAGRGDHPRRGSGEIPSHEVGLAILGPLRELDEVAYLRFASVYRAFESLSDFEAEISALRAEHPAGWRPAETSRWPALRRRRRQGSAPVRGGPARPSPNGHQQASQLAGRIARTSGEDLYRSAMGSDADTRRGQNMTETASGSARAGKGAEGARCAASTPARRASL